MANGMPELGSKISLISKADIRYEGRLFTVDPHECTIALATVRSFGTEDRDTPFPVAPQTQIYDYILFRGSDIKDIRVVNNVNNPVPNDPAIMQLSVPPTLGQPSYQQPGYSHPVLGAAMGQYGAPYGGITNLPQSIAAGIANRPIVKQSSELSREDGQPIHTDQGVRNSPHELLSGGGGSRSGTPISMGASRKSPTSDQGVQVTPGLGAPGSKRGGSNAGQRQNQSRNRERKESKGDRSESRASNEQQSKTNKPTSSAPAPPAQPQTSSQIHQNAQQQGQNQRGQTNQRNNRQRGRGRGGLQGNYRQQNTSASGPRPKNTLKFENDYDFEEANTQFEELRSQFGKLKVDDKAPVTVNGDVDKKDDSGNETGAGENEHEEDTIALPVTEVCYDKTKSFFDNISCEAVERSLGRSQRTDWRTERKLNSETFGVASARRGGYRGRGGYYRGNMYRGGYRGYRGRGNNRGGAQFNQQPISSNGPQNPSHSTQQSNRGAPIAAAAGN
uniref:Uncharacterized protein n=1 Tax=Xenopsylla cheopis TaxID=163159 RepID=A0A6M2DUL7_XENCH